MTSQAAALPRLTSAASRGTLYGGVFLAAGVVGVAVAYDVQIGIALVMGMIYAPIALYRLPVGIALFIPLVFLEAMPAFNLAGKASGLLLTGAWAGLVLDGRSDLAGFVSRHKRMAACLGLLLLWMTLSYAWAESTGAVLADLWHWYAVALLFLIIATTITSAKSVKLTFAAFVGGAVFSIVLGYATGKFNDGSALATAAADTARLEGALGDPNFLAAGAIAAIVLAAGLAATTRNTAARWALAVGVVILTAGVLTSQSRGGMLAALAVIGASFIVFKRRRAAVFVGILALVGAAAIFFATTPSAWERITDINNGGSGRTDLWTVGWRIFEDHPVVGAGLNNYQELAADYTRRPGVLKYVANIVEKPHVMHNTYLQLMAENGVIGLALFLGFVVACLHSCLAAARRFAAAGREALEVMSQSVFVAIVAMLVAGFFISAGVDKRMWVIFALGPALYAVSLRPEEEDRQADELLT